VDITGLIASVGHTVKERFESERRVLSFQSYLELFDKRPWEQSRDAVRYLRDCFDHFGSYEVERLGQKFKRWRLFDGFERDESSGRYRRREALFGNEAAQRRVYQLITGFAREGRANRLILLHGPNGSAKSTFVSCIMNALEIYSEQDQGALYRFSWIFPHGRDGMSIGFDNVADVLDGADSFAELPDGSVEAKVSSELREHPLLLLPLDQRRLIVDQAYAEHQIKEAPPDWIRFGLLGHKNKQIYDALLTAYRGDLAKVLTHVQVERYYHSRRYRVGLVTIGPEMAVDAFERQLTADRSLHALPASLSSVNLFETYGQLVDASAGIVEYSDLLKRPIDAWRYLLLAIETGEVSLSFSKVPLNCVMFATTNELHLTAFKGHHEYRSFRSRFQLERMPYLLNYKDEQAIYDTQIALQLTCPVAPHATFTAAVWAVLTRLVRPRADRYRRKSLGRLAAQLQPMEKAELYAEQRAPERFTSEEANELLADLPEIVEEAMASDAYEGLNGASPREIRSIILEAASDSRRQTLTPMAVLERIEAFCDRSDFDFLKQDKESGYFDHRGFIEQVQKKWLDRVDEELRIATGLVEEGRHLELFYRYVTHVSYWVKSERIYNPVTGKDENPDTEMMAQVEQMLDAGAKPGDFRRDLIGAVAAHALDHPGKGVDYARIFPRHLARMREAYFNEHKRELVAVAQGILKTLSDEAADEFADSQQQASIASTYKVFIERFGYNDEALREALAELVRYRYSS